MAEVHRASHDRDYWEKARAEVEAWEQGMERGGGIFSKMANAVMGPVGRVVETVVPDRVQEAAGRAVAGVLGKLNDAAGWTVKGESIDKKVAAARAELFDELKAADEVARSCWKRGVALGGAEGAATGAAGLPGLVADIPALLTIALRVVQQVGQCYGYDTTIGAEREYVLHVLRTGSTVDSKLKMSFLMIMKELEQVLIKVGWQKAASGVLGKELARLSLTGGVQQMAKALGVQLTQRKALQIVPVVGAVVGGAFNATFLNDVAKAAYMSYRRRFMSEREG
ncbi:MAG TPA: EcsC family protein [Tepidisphaeraceae bacterium]|nr:EcsC family protein [Tepidisphaeraceae bacterium]